MTVQPSQLAKFITPVLILALLGIVVKKSGFDWNSLPASSPPADSAPQDTIYATLEAARAGDTKRYLDLHAGSMRASLDQMDSESGEAGFQRYLKSRSAELKGLAVFDPKPITGTEVELRVEYVYQDRNETQLMTLEKSADGWKIVRSANAERAKTLVPYGTPVQ